MNAPVMNEPLVEVRGLKKYFKTKAGFLHAVDDLNLQIRRGETLGIVGESGCGKSTLGRLMVRLLDPTEGDIFFAGENITRCSQREARKLRTDIQIIFQDPYSSLNPRMTVAQIIAEPLIVNRIVKDKGELDKRVDELMDLVGLAHRLRDTYPHELDGGRRQRIGIARALSVEPKFIVCDEPVSALDVSIQAQIINLLLDLQDQMGLTYMFITHNLSVVKYISDEIAVMYLGQCVERAPASELFRNPLHPYTQALLQAIPEPRLSVRNKTVQTIRGEVVSPIDPLPGCRFASRCGSAKACCTGTPVRTCMQGQDHFVMCTLYDGSENSKGLV